MSNYRDVFDDIAREDRLDRMDPSRPLRRERKKLVRDRKLAKLRIKEIDRLLGEKEQTQ